MKDHKMIKYGIVINASRCIDCKACLIACKAHNRLPQGFWRNWIKPLWREDGGLKNEFQPGQCMQCDAPSCVAACPVGATYKANNGLVAIDRNKCIGCGNCVSACPYGARYRDPKMRIVDKCDFCEHRLKRGEQPACVETCPTKSRIFGDLNNPESAVAKMATKEELVQIVHPLVNTNPNIYYLKGTQQLDWPKVPTLPGEEHVAPTFWKFTSASSMDVPSA